MMTTFSRTTIFLVAVVSLAGLGAGCATTPKRLEPVAKDQAAAGKFLKEMDVVEQPELEPDWADWVKDRYPNWRQHYWVDRGQWGNRGYLIGKAPTTDTNVPAQMTPLPPAPPANVVASPVIESTPPPVIEKPAMPTSYTVKKGDSLWKISGKLYGNPLKWPRIYRANKDKIKNPHRIYPGQVLAIPAK